MKDIKQTIVKLENDLRSVAKWGFEHQLLINPNKTKFLLIGSRPMLQNFIMYKKIVANKPSEGQL
jgi:hypothetical protein